MDGWSALMTIALLLVPTAVLTVGLVLFLRLWTRGRLRDGLAYLVYLHGRRSRFVALFVTMTGSFVLAGVVGTLGFAGLLTPAVTNSLSGLLFSVGSVALFLALWWGLQPWPSTGEERSSLLREMDEHRAYVLGVIDRAESRR